jgi:hypothetical protein
MTTVAAPDTNLTSTDGNNFSSSCEEWLLLRVGAVPRNSLGWFRCGVGFYNKKEYTKAIECFEKSVQLDPMNVIIFLLFYFETLFFLYYTKKTTFL